MFWVRRGGDDARAVPISTSEISLTNTVREQVLAESALPIRAHGAQPCFPLRSRQRRARHARHDPPAPVRQGRDGADRPPEKSSARRSERMVGHAEAILRKLELPYRVVVLCTGDMGFWLDQDLRPRGLAAGAEHLPRDQLLLELRSLPGARMQARFKNAQVRTNSVHTLNGSGLAVGRALVAVLENHQQADGSSACRRAAAPTSAGSTCSGLIAWDRRRWPTNCSRPGTGRLIDLPERAAGRADAGAGLRSGRRAPRAAWRGDAAVAATRSASPTARSGRATACSRRSGRRCGAHADAARRRRGDGVASGLVQPRLEPEIVFGFVAAARRHAGRRTARLHRRGSRTVSRSSHPLRRMALHGGGHGGGLSRCMGACSGSARSRRALRPARRRARGASAHAVAR